MVYFKHYARKVNDINIKKTLGLLVCCLFLFAIMPSCQFSPNVPIPKTQFLFNTIVRLTVYDKQDEAILNDTFTWMRQYEALFSRSVPQSDLDRINHAQGVPIEVDAQTAHLLERSLHFKTLSNGAFDVTAGALLSLWNFSSENAQVPSSSAIEAALGAVGRDIHIAWNEKNAFVTVDEGTQLDVGAIAKGYIADQTVQYLKERGVDRAIVDLGGDISLFGEKPFTVGIRDPFNGPDVSIAALQISNTCVVSSGAYERFFMQDDVAYHHILDLTTGYPAQSDLAGITVVCEDGARADAMSTILFILGKEKGYALASSEPDLEALFIDSDGNITYTEGLEGKVEILR